MSYTPINWQTGDTITAEKMNKMDNGWGLEASQLFSETVTTATASGEPAPVGMLSFSEFITDPSIVVSFDGTDYTVQLTEGFANIYGEVGQGGPSFANYPFCLLSMSDGTNIIYTETAGTYTVTVTASALAVGDSFKTAVQTAGQDAFAGIDTTSYELLLGESTFADVWEAMVSGRRIYRRNSIGGEQYYAFVVYADWNNLSVKEVRMDLGGISSAVYTADSLDGVLH